MKRNLVSAAAAMCLALAPAAVAADEATAAAPAVVPLGHVETRGAGPTHLVLIGGLACDWTVWAPFMERNADRYTMHAVTLPGMAGSPAPEARSLEEASAEPTATPWLDNAVRAVVAMMDERGVDKAVFVGHSLGAWVATMAALEHPERTQGLVTVDAMPMVPVGAPVAPRERAVIVEADVRPNFMQITDEMWEADQRQMARFVVLDTAAAEKLGKMFCQTPVSVAAEYYLEQMKKDLSDRIKDLQPPLLALVSLEMPVDAPQLAEDRVRVMHRDAYGPAPRGQVVFFDYTRHFLMLDRPEAFDAAIAAFVAGEPAQPFPPTGAGIPDDFYEAMKRLRAEADAAPGQAP